MDSSGDSNALILPAKTKNQKSKPKSKPILSCQNKKLSNSQKRKLRKLEEEKEQELLLSKSLENLEKYTISDNAYLLLRSSENIGQAETTKEKRRREMQFSKAGLDLPVSDTGTKRKKVESCDDEPDDSQSFPLEDADKNVTYKPLLIERAQTNGSTCSVSSQGAGEQHIVGDLGGNEPKELVQVANEDSCKVMDLDARNSSLSQSSDCDKKSVATTSEFNDEPQVASYGTKCVGGNPIPGPRIAPTVVHVSRPIDVENARMDLPIIMMEQEIMETINSHSSVIISGETGCGKTTQLPQFLYEAGYGSGECSMKGGVIGVTQPRRVAVLSTARRVAYELGLTFGKEVGFQVKHEKGYGDNCSIKYMTDGILLRELQMGDFLLKRYSVIILDEAHERSLNTDILIGMLSRVVKQRQEIFEMQQKVLDGGKKVETKDRVFPLKLILMSATMRVEDFTSGGRIFPKSTPVIHVSGREFTVTTHFSKKTELTDYIGEAYRKVLKIHKRGLASGGILVFVTGQREVEDLCRMLRQASKQFEARRNVVNTETKTITMDRMGQIDGCTLKEIDEAFNFDASSVEQQTDRFSCYDERHDESDNSNTYSSCSSGSDSESGFESDDENLEDQKTSELDDSIVDFTDVNFDSLKASFEALADQSVKTSSNKTELNVTTQDVCSNQSFSSTKKNGKKKGPIGPLHVLPLYAMLPAASQLRVFEKVKEGERLVVVATNVAETSLTIPGIRYVIDTGREKVKEYNPVNEMESYKIQWISQASAKQRAGRAGRTGPGRCYRLYSSAAMCNEFPEFSCPEILKVPVDDIVLRLKSMKITKVVNFPFPTSPDAAALVKAEKCLKALEALDSDGRLTPLGKTMAHFPLSPRHARLLLLAIQITKKEKSGVRPNLVLSYAVAVAAAMSSPNPFPFQFDGNQKNSEGTEMEDGSGSVSQKNGDQDTKLSRKQMKKTIKLSRAKFSNLKSDALTVAYALQCFEQSKDPSQFCTENTLHLKTMVEMSKLRKQLLQLVFKQRYCDVEQDFSWPHGTIKDVEDDWSVSSDKIPLSENEENILCQAICAGWADRVAKRIRGASVLSSGDRRINANRYQAPLVKETVFLYRSSSVSKAAPEFLVYKDIVCTKRPFIQEATSVNSEWLVKHAGSLCTYSAPLADPKPFYDPLHDQVFCYVTPYFGPYLWELPRNKVPIKDTQQRITVFAYALLDGQVLPCLKPYKCYMAIQPINILKPEALGQKRVGNLISKLTGLRAIDSCAKLKAAWNEDPQLLYSEILDWFQKEFHSQFKILWEKMLQEALSVTQDRFPGRAKKRKCRVKD
ncbi:ATP-dependent RNA helicase DEAH13-like [Chenopodium quinoa]|uniref:ATP-dependent RNA helicase DEAH13-like n=1 Tax=Chenopodium quinoa TaxID=63459 RepID=UPI000B79A41D|nr:ATP-dependent RNA helicase DEAH13-like [Chenopodium quinoa]XP_021763229.1 ATP-dependent RNA helicase DEAH13-like [Chenopodium quinoa]XP_021763230.1 ATP-dependent RNA helicase DEAH13-like [Chenopodium quinoa]